MNAGTGLTRYYTHSPPLKHSRWKAWCQLLVWFFYHPSAWCELGRRLRAGQEEELASARVRELRVMGVMVVSAGAASLLAINQASLPILLLSTLIVGLVGVFLPLPYLTAWSVTLGLATILLEPIWSSDAATMAVTAMAVASGVAAAVQISVLRRWLDDDGSTTSILALSLGIALAWSSLLIWLTGGISVTLLLVGLLVYGLGLSLHAWRPLLTYPLQLLWHRRLWRADSKQLSIPARLRRHAVFWDEHQSLPWPTLEDHLILLLEENPTEGTAARDFVNRTHYQAVAEAATFHLLIDALRDCNDLSTIRAAHRLINDGQLGIQQQAWLHTFARISQDVDSSLRYENLSRQRQALIVVADQLNQLTRDLNRDPSSPASRLQAIASRWRRLISQHADHLAQEVAARQEIVSPYVVGAPLGEQQSVFVGRGDVAQRLERSILAPQAGSILLYGQRRMGKTSLLNNLGRLLPASILPLLVDLQGPASLASDYAGFLYNLARSMSRSAQDRRRLSLPPLSRQDLASDPFTRFDEWMDEVESMVAGRTILLALDEFEALDQAIAEGRYEERAILGTLRHLIQHRPRWRVLLAASHDLEELHRWAGYLINVQVIHLGYLDEGEALQLIERPTDDFPLRYTDQASQLVLQLTRGHPFLLQLLCDQVVAIKNAQPPLVRRLADGEDVVAALPEVMVHGSFFFADIEHNQVSPRGRHLLHVIASTTAREPLSLQDLEARGLGDLSESLAALVRRELVDLTAGGVQFQVPMIREWFTGQGSSPAVAMPETQPD